MSNQVFHLPRAYGVVALLVSGITGSCLVAGDLERMQRQHSFNQDYMDFEFNEIHQREVGDDTAALGLPDDGNGRYMSRRPYADWYFFNVAKRVHRNDVEHLVTLAPLSLVNGLLMPYPTIGLLATYFVGRQLYTSGYFEKEGALNKLRVAGSIMCNIAHFSTLVLAVVIGWRISRGKLRL